MGEGSGVLCPNISIELGGPASGVRGGEDSVCIALCFG